MTDVLRSCSHSVTPTLSVVIPFYRDDPSDTLQTIAAQADNRVEILAWDDGTNDPALTDSLRRLLPSLPADIRVFTGNPNRGRSAARNALVDAARAPWVLFLDADMQPTDPQFLDRYLDAIDADSGDVLFGGFTVPEIVTPQTRLHREFALRSDCDTADIRAQHGPKHVASSNLCVRKSVLAREAFDSGFIGWGWEDSEWAARVATAFRIVHLDNPAIHLGLETTHTLLRRFATSGANYARFARAHPALVESLPLYRHAARLAGLPGQALMRPILRALVAMPLPASIRITALKLWRASHYAPHIPPQARVLHEVRS